MIFLFSRFNLIRLKAASGEIGLLLRWPWNFPESPTAELAGDLPDLLAALFVSPLFVAELETFTALKGQLVIWILLLNPICELVKITTIARKVPCFSRLQITGKGIAKQKLSVGVAVTAFGKEIDSHRAVPIAFLRLGNYWRGKSKYPNANKEDHPFHAYIP
jgi:hypothetical protein